MGSYVYRVTNISKSIQSFQGYTLAPEKWLTTHILSPGVITGYKKGNLAIYPDILDIDVFKVVNISPNVMALDDIMLRPNEAVWVGGLNSSILTAYQLNQVALDPDPFTVPVYDGSSAPSPAPTGGGGVNDNLVVVTNAEATTLVLGVAIYSDQNNLRVRKAQANDATTKSVWGLVADASIAAGATGNIILGGVLVGSTAQWNAATGMSGGLVMDAPYYLSTDAPGRITPFAASPIDGESLWSIQVGYAISSTQLKVEIQQSIRL